MKKLSRTLACVAPLLFVNGGAAMAQSTSAPYLTASRYLDGGLLAGTISPAASGSSNFPAVRNTYDSYGRLQKVEVGVLSSWQAETVLPANWSGFSVLKVQSFSYDVDGRKIQDTFADGNGTISNIIQYSYDAYNRLICTATRMNPAVFGSLPSDACTLGAQGSNGPDRITTNVYDALDRVIQVRRAVGTSLEQAYATYSYTVDGKQQDIVDANGNHTLQTYDGHDRLLMMAFPSPTGPSGYNPATQATALSTAGAANAGDYESYGYDANGNRTSLRKRDSSTIGYQYDALNRMTLKDLQGGTASDVYYDYDNRGLMLDAKFASLGGLGTSFAYDFAGRKTSETNYGQIVSYQYDNDGNRTRLTWPDGYYVSYGYDGLNRMQTAKQNGTLLLGTYSYDQLQRVAQLQYASGAPAPSVGLSWSTWDDLLTLSHTMAGSNSVSFSDSYSPAHQILQASISNAAYQYYPAFAGTMAYAPNGLNQYHVITPPGGSATTIGYDANGNLTSDGVFSYGYDPENRLISASQTGVSASYLYDPEGRRRQKQVTGGSYAGTTQFLDAGDDEIAEYNGSGTLLNRYVPGRAVDQPIVQVTAAGSKRYFHLDKTGSVIATSEGGGGRYEGPYTYDAYGNCLGGGVPCAGGVPYKYTGRRYDPETGLYYYRARYYSPTIGRFLQTDPIGYKDDINLYTYVGNDPTDKTDPSGNAGVEIDAFVLGAEVNYDMRTNDVWFSGKVGWVGPGFNVSAESDLPEAVTSCKHCRSAFVTSQANVGVSLGPYEKNIYEHQGATTTVNVEGNNTPVISTDRDSSDRPSTGLPQGQYDGKTRNNGKMPPRRNGSRRNTNLHPQFKLRLGAQAYMQFGANWKQIEGTFLENTWKFFHCNPGSDKDPPLCR